MRDVHDWFADLGDGTRVALVVAGSFRSDAGVLLNELASVHLDPRGAELLFQVLTEREERASIAVVERTEPHTLARLPGRLTVGAGPSPVGGARRCRMGR